MPTNPRLKFKRGLAHDPVTGMWHVRQTVDGHTLQKAFYSKLAANRWRDHRALTAVGVPDDDATAPTLAEARDAYLDRLALLNRRDTTAQYYRAKLTTLVAGLGDRRLDRITQRHIEAYVAARTAAGQSGGTVNKELGALITLYKHTGVRQRWHLPALSHTPAERIVYNPDRIRALWDALDPETRLAVGLCLFLGLRAEEAYKVTRGMVDGDELRLPSDITKTSSGNRTWICPTLAALIPDGPADRPLITLTRGQIRHRLEPASAAAGCDPAITGIGHMRHHCTTWADECGWTEREIQQVTRHTTGSVTKRYTHSHSIRLKKRILSDVESYFLGTWTDDQKGQ